MMDPLDPPGRRDRGGPWGRWILVAVAILKPLLFLLTRERWGGRRHVPAAGGVILAANHLSNADPATIADFVLFGCGRVPAFLAKSPLFGVPGLGAILIGAQQIPVFRGQADGGGALSAAVERLRGGACVVIYPEGTTTRDPARWPMLARTGVARLVLESGCPVVPVGQWGQQRIRPGRRPVCRTLAGPPVDLSAYAGRALSVEVLRAATADVMHAVTALVAELRGEPAPAAVFDPRRGLRAEPT